MDTGRPFPATGSRAIPRQIIQGSNSPCTITAKALGDANAGQPGRKVHAPVKISSQKHTTHQQVFATPGLNAGRSLTRHAHKNRQSGHLPRSAHPPAIQSPSTSTQPKKTAPWPLSRLESLPTEILEQIFFYTLTLNIDGSFLNLPRASWSIGRKLWSHFVRKEVFLRMCSDPRPERFDKSRDDLTTKDFHIEHAKTQSWILRQEWLTHEFIRYCILEYMVSILVHEMSKHNLHWLSQTGPLVTLKLEPAIRNYISQCSGQSPPSPMPPNTHYVERQWVEHFYPVKQVTLILSPATGYISLQILEDKRSPFCARWRLVSLNSGTQIPSRLLQGPWTPSKIELLELFIRGGATVDWINTTAGEVAEIGFFDAMVENNSRALRALCICDNETRPGERKDVRYKIGPSRGIGLIPEQKHLLFAIDQGCRADIIETLLSAPRSACDLQTAEVVQRIYQMEKRGWLELARWLAERRERDKDRKRTRTLEPRYGMDSGWLNGPLDLGARAFGPF